jgi:hypothetical protein
MRMAELVLMELKMLVLPMATMYACKKVLYETSIIRKF